MGDIVERLRGPKFRNSPSGALQCKTTINPDGPEAADEITALRARVKELEKALVPFARLGVMANFAFAPALFADGDQIRGLPWKDGVKNVTITFGNLRAASQALKGDKQ